MSNLRIAQAQINPIVGDFAKNLELISQNIEKARLAKADLVVFPELALCGYPPEDLLLKPQYVKDCEKALQNVVSMTKDITVVVGYVLEEKGKIYNAAAVCSDEKLLGVYRKIELPNYGVFDEKRYFTPGRGCLYLEINGVLGMVTICEDAWVEQSRLHECAKDNAIEFAVNISCSPFSAGKLAVRKGVLQSFAYHLDSLIFYTNVVGGQDELVFDGGSLVMDKAGQVLNEAKRFEEDLLLTDIQFKESEKKVKLNKYDALVKASLPETVKDQELPLRKTEEFDELAEIHQALVLGVRDYMGKNGFQKVVLGLSGGIDSALVAALAQEALGAENVIGVTMPSQYTSRETKGDAEQLAENLGIKLLTVPIAKILGAYLDEMAPSLGKGPMGVTAENLQARIRGNILMGLSNRFGWLVLTTGNKSEVAVGYCTLYGDTAGGFAVIKDLPKTMVYALSKRINQEADKELIPESTITRPPTAELRPNQKDEDSLPPYDLLDPVIAAYVEKDKVPAEIISQGFDPELVYKVARLIDLNEYKRRQAAPGIKITPKAFGKDRRLPITNHYRPGWG